MQKDIKEPLLGVTDNKVQDQDNTLSGQYNANIASPGQHLSKSSNLKDRNQNFYNNQLCEFEAIKLNLDKYKQANQEDVDVMKDIQESGDLLKQKYWNTKKGLNNYGRMQLHENPIKILPPIKQDIQMTAQAQKAFIELKKDKDTDDPEEIYNMMRLKQLEDAFNEGVRHEVDYNQDVISQHADLIISSQNEIILVQTGIDINLQPVLLLRQPEREGNKAEEHLEENLDKPHDHKDDNVKKATIQLQVNTNAGEKSGKQLWNTLPDAQAKLWIQLRDDIYYWTVENDWESKETKFVMKKFNILTFTEELVGDEYKTDFLTLKNDNYDFGIQLVSWGTDMIGVAKEATQDLAANMLTKKNIQEYLKNQFMLYQGQAKNEKEENVVCGMIVAANKMDKVLYSWKQSTPMAQSYMNKNAEDTSISFMLAIWQTSNLKTLEARIKQKGYWGAGMVYKMSRGTAKISKQVFWIKEDGDSFIFDNDREKIDNSKTDFGMIHFKSYKKKANCMFQNYYHQIFTLDQTFDGKVTFTMETLSPDDPKFKIDLFQKSIRGCDLEHGEYKQCPKGLLSNAADVDNNCLREQLMMVIQRQYNVKHDKVRAVVIEHAFNATSPHRIKSVLNRTVCSAVLMEPFDYHRANTWTKIQRMWSKGYKQVNQYYCNIFVDDVDGKLHYIEPFTEGEFEPDVSQVEGGKKKITQEQQKKIQEDAKKNIQSKLLLGVQDSYKGKNPIRLKQKINEIANKLQENDKSGCYHHIYNTVRKLEKSDLNPYENEKYTKVHGNDAHAQLAQYNSEYGKITARKFEHIWDDRGVYLRQVWGYDQTNKEIFIQIMKRTEFDTNDHDKVLSDVHVYTYQHPDPNTGVITDGFQTSRMKNSTFIPSSAVESLGQDNFQQKFELMIMDESSLFAEIFVYLFKWNDKDPTEDNVILQLIGRKMLILSYPYQPDQGQPRLINYYPWIPENNYKIEGTHLFSNHNNATVNWNLEIKPFTSDEYQFKGELCNTGYRIYEYQYPDVKGVIKNRQCALLIDTQLNQNIINLNEKDIETKRREKKEYDAEDSVHFPWGPKPIFEPILNNIQKNLIFEDQIRVTLNLWVREPLSKIIKNTGTPFTKTDYLAPLEIMKGLSFANFLISEPNAIIIMEQNENIQSDRSLISQFGVFMKWDSRVSGALKNCWDDFLKAIPQDKGWIRGDKELMEDYFFQNPLFKCLDSNKKDDIKRTQVSCNILIKKVLESPNNQQNYNRLIQILPMITGELAKEIKFESYAPFFQDFDDENENPITFALKVEDHLLPKFATEDYLLQRFDVSTFPDTDLKDNLTDHLIDEFKHLKQAVVDKKSEAIFDVPVKHFMINLSYMQTSRLLQTYFYGNKEKKVPQPGELSDKSYMGEQIFTQTLYDVNMKYGDKIDDQETMKDILDYIFFHGTKKYIIFQVVFYVCFFVMPFLIQMGLTMSQFHDKEDKEYYVKFSTGCVLISMFANCCMYCIEILQMKQSGISDYFRDDFYNIFDTTSFFIFAFYFFLRLKHPIPMLVGSTPDLKDVKVDGILMITILFNALILILIVVKIFFYLRVNQKFGLQVQLVIQAMHDVKNFSAFMFIWITAFAIYTKVLGSGNSMENTNANEWGGYPGTNTDFQIWMQTWEDSIGNIQNPTYLYWSTIIANNTAIITEAKNPNYLIDLSQSDMQPKDMFENIATRTTDFQANTAIFMIYTIYVFWILNQIFIFIILLNFLIAVISQSYEKVMDSKIQLQYSQRSILNNEFKIVWGSLGLLEKRCDVFYLTSNVEASDRGNEWSGFVQNMKKAIGKQTVQINNNLKDLTKSISDAQIQVQHEIKENETANNRDINRLKDLVKEFSIQLQHEVTEEAEPERSHTEHDEVSN